MQVEWKAKDEEGMTMFVAERQCVMETKGVFEISARETGWRSRTLHRWNRSR